MNDNNDKQWEVLPPEAEPTPNVDSASRNTRLWLAFAVAIVSDGLSIWLEFAPPLQWGLDIATALALFLILGRQMLLLPALITEAIPGLAVFPAWILVVGSIGLWGSIKKQP
jgi:hypothetical protein